MGALALWYLIRSWKTGTIVTPGGYRPRDVQRNANPALYWFCFAVFAIIDVLIWLAVVRCVWLLVKA